MLGGFLLCMIRWLFMGDEMGSIGGLAGLGSGSRWGGGVGCRHDLH